MDAALLDESTLLLARTPAVLELMLTGLPDELVHRNDGPGTWSAYNIAGHLMHGDAANWLPRAKIILEHGPGKSFEAFDREAMLRWEQEPVNVLLAEFASRRRDSLAQLAALDLSEGDLGRHGLHPDLGDVTLGQLLASWVAHDLTHLAQIGEVLARRFRDEVGPWRVYMPALEGIAAAE